MEPDVLSYLKEACVSRIYQPGELIFQQGSDAEEFYYLESGLSLTYTILEDGRERNVLISWPGRLFGMSTFFEQVKRQSSAIALSRSCVLTITAATYRECLSRFPGFRDDIITELSKDIGILFDELVDSSLMPSDVRVARFLCRRMLREQCTVRNGLYELHYTQSVIASILGISRLSVNQAMTRFAAQGWIATRYGKTTILAPTALREFAYEDSSDMDANDTTKR